MATPVRPLLSLRRAIDEHIRNAADLEAFFVRIEGAQARVLSRCRDNPEGPWRGDGRWVVGAEARTYDDLDL